MDFGSDADTPRAVCSHEHTFCQCFALLRMVIFHDAAHSILAFELMMRKHAESNQQTPMKIYRGLRSAHKQLPLIDQSHDKCVMNKTAADAHDCTACLMIRDQRRWIGEVIWKRLLMRQRVDVQGQTGFSKQMFPETGLLLHSDKRLVEWLWYIATWVCTTINHIIEKKSGF